MKLFNTIEELWDYCLICPICQNTSREIILTVGPDDNFGIASYEKEGAQLRVVCSYQRDRFDKKSLHTATFLIDCQQNTFQIEAISPDPEIVKAAQQAYFFMYMHANCERCFESYLNSSDLEFDIENKSISNIQMDREGIYIASEKDKFHITLSHDRNVMSVSRVYPEQDGEVDDENIIDLPLVNLDLSNPAKVINKVKTLILFS